MMRLTDAAAGRIKSMMANAGRPIVGVRVGVKNGGCAGMEYTMEYAETVIRSTRWSRTRASHPDRPQGGAVSARNRDGLPRREAGGEFLFLNPNET